MDMTNEKVPNPGELEKELNDYLNKKYGKRFRLGVTPAPIPQADPEKNDEDTPGEEPPALPELNFDIKPEELESYLDEYIIKQRKAKEILATKICTHFNRIKMLQRSKRFSDPSQVGTIKNNIIMIGPTGVGKTYLIKLIAKKIGVPFVKGDATKFSETGYVGGDVEDLVRDLVAEANGNIERAQYGIIYLDEIDKIASSQNLIGPDVSRTGVQRALLKPMEETDVELRVPHDIISQMEALEQYRKTGTREKQKVNTKNILFIMSGAFNGLEEIIGKRLHRQGLGFGADIHSRNENENLLSQVKAEDLIEYGFESEFIGRLPVIAVFERLVAPDLYEILRNINNPIVLGKKKDFKAYGIDIKFQDEALEKVAVNAFEERTGARGLVSALEKVLLPFEKKLPSTSTKRLLVTTDLVEDPETRLDRLLQSPVDTEEEDGFRQIRAIESQRLKQSLYKRREELTARYGFFPGEEIIDALVACALEEAVSVSAAYEEAIRARHAVKSFELDFLQRHGLTIEFDEEALSSVISESLRRTLDPVSVCLKAVQNYEYGLKLIKERTGKDTFTIQREAITDSEGYLNRLIRMSYR
jgi:ATP-dependent Clp protease ATP-binding subunit ClpX